MNLRSFLYSLTLVFFISVLICGIIFVHHFLLSPGSPFKSPPLPQKQGKTQERYLFKYVGKEKFGNVFAVYRFDKVSGRIERFSYIYYD